ncbi:MAG: nicotinate-nucleotide adenylyltransferase [Betaproteobacteria bacterium]|nr:nicotinate-nucleotide adenylyltransferase [Betaproteobacteria bacterium]
MPEWVALATEPAESAEPPYGKPLGVFGGTFDPVHFGHLRLAEEAADSLGLQRIRWIPAGQPRHREAENKAPQAGATHRLAMVRVAIAGNPRFQFDPAEADAARASYTVPTLERLRNSAGCGAHRPLVLLLGADAFAGLSGWHRWEVLLSLAHVAVAHRPGFPLDGANLPAELADLYRLRRCDTPAALADTPAGLIVSFAMTPLAISATEIRARLTGGLSARYLLPDAVIAYIRANHLYPAKTPPT